MDPQRSPRKPQTQGEHHRRKIKEEHERQNISPTQPKFFCFLFSGKEKTCLSVVGLQQLIRICTRDGDGGNRNKACYTIACET